MHLPFLISSKDDTVSSHIQVFFSCIMVYYLESNLSSNLYEEINLKLLYMGHDTKAADNRSFSTVNIDV